MNFHELPELKIGDLIVKVPIIQGGMGVGISGANLASSVADEGGIGVIASVGLGAFEADLKNNYKKVNVRKLKEEIRIAKSKTKGIIGVNIMQALSDFDEHIMAVIEERVDIVFIGAGLLLRYPADSLIDKMEKIKTKFIPKVASDRATKLIFSSWAKRYNLVPDAVVLEGPLSGGHQGVRKENIMDPEYSLEKLLEKVIEVIKPFEVEFKKKIPIIVGGGVYTGSDILKFFKLGASAVKMATRFVTTEECDAADEFKQQYIDCKKEDIIIIDSPVGLPARVIKNKFIEDVQMGNKKPVNCNWKCLKTCDFNNVSYCIANALSNAKKGNLKDGFAFAGSNAYRAEKISTVKEVFDSLKQEYSDAVKAEKNFSI